MSFFIRGKNKPSVALKRKVSKAKQNKEDVAKVKKKRKLPISDEEILSESEESDLEGGQKKAAHETDSEEEQETAQDKRLRLTKEYLAQIAKEEAEKEEDELLAKDAVAHRLKQDILDQAGKLQKDVAKSYIQPKEEDIRVLRGHQLSVTCLVLSPDDKYIFSGSKDCSIIKWCIETGKKVKVIPGGRKGTEAKHIGHTGHVMCLAISSSGKYLASGDTVKLIHIWDPETCRLLHTFKGHRAAVSGLAFRKNSHQLFSASNDRSVKIWSVDERAYVETLFGHQDQVTGIDSLSRERAVTSGGRDGSVRIWKVIEESQLVFQGHKGSIDCVALINEQQFVSGADDNSIALWGVVKKKPLTTIENAHSGNPDDPTTLKSNWITSVTSLQHTDLVASGSKDGCVRFWQCGADFRSLTPLFALPLVGFVNSLKFSSDGSFLVAGIGQEHRLGRWWRLKQARNSVCIIKLHRDTLSLSSDTAAQSQREEAAKKRSVAKT